MGKYYTLVLFLSVIQLNYTQCDSQDIFANETSSAYCFDTVNQVRKCYTNDIPSHTHGPFGGAGAILGQDFEYSMCLYPEKGTEVTTLFEDVGSQGCGGGVVFGISQIGINYSPFARLYFVNPNTLVENLNFHEEAVNILNMDINGGHVNTLGRYHYHSAPLDYIVNDLGINGVEHSPLLGYAADGFPIYYKYLYTDPLDSNSLILGFQSSYQLKTGTRAGDGVTAPDGSYDGTYYEDYEFSTTLSELDECGGRFGITPEYPNGIYYYVLTDNWPYIPRCLKGQFVDNSFKIGPNCPTSTSVDDCSFSSVGLNVEKEILNFDVFPNPSSTLIRLKLDDNIVSELTSLRIYNVNADQVYFSSSFQEYINVDDLSNGVYFIQLDFKNQQITKKIIIQ